MSSMMFSDFSSGNDTYSSDDSLTSITTDGMLVPDNFGDTDDIQEKLEGIAAGMEAIASIGKIIQVARNTATHSPALIKVTNIAIEEIKNSVGIFSNGVIVAAECVNDTSISIEGLGDIITSIWNAIVRTFKAIWDSIAGLFTKTKAEVNKSAAQKAVIDLKAAVTVTKNKEITTPEVLVGELEFLSRAFAYMGKDFTIPNLTIDAQKLAKTITQCSQLVNSIELANMNMLIAVEKFNKEGVQDSSARFADESIQVYYRGISSVFDESNELDHYKKELMEKLSIDYNTVDRKSVRCLNGLTRGVKIFAFHMKDVVKDGIEYHFFITQDNMKETQSIASQFVFDPNAEVSYCYAEQALSAQEELVFLIELYQRKFTHIRQLQERVLKDMGNYIHHNNLEEQNNAVTERMRIYQDVTCALGKASSTINSTIHLVQRSADDHSHLLKYLVTKWNISVNKVK